MPFAGPSTTLKPLNLAGNHPKITQKRLKTPKIGPKSPKMGYFCQYLA
jgi:hypothetical protein